MNKLEKIVEAVSSILGTEYSVRLHCSEVEFDAGEYKDTVGIVDSLIGSCIESAATALSMLLEMHDEQLVCD